MNPVLRDLRHDPLGGAAPPGTSGCSQLAAYSIFSVTLDLPPGQVDWM
jgi:hypothetical protein